MPLLFPNLSKEFVKFLLDRNKNKKCAKSRPDMVSKQGKKKQEGNKI